METLTSYELTELMAFCIFWLMIGFVVGVRVGKYDLLRKWEQDDEQ